eukprot:CFRG6750T1
MSLRGDKEKRTALKSEIQISQQRNEELQRDISFLEQELCKQRLQSPNTTLPSDRSETDLSEDREFRELVNHARKDPERIQDILQALRDEIFSLTNTESRLLAMTTQMQATKPSG